MKAFCCLRGALGGGLAPDIYLDLRNDKELPFQEELPLRRLFPKRLSPSMDFWAHICNLNSNCQLFLTTASSRVPFEHPSVGIPCKWWSSTFNNSKPRSGKYMQDTSRDPPEIHRPCDDSVCLPWNPSRRHAPTQPDPALWLSPGAQKKQRYHDIAPLGVYYNKKLLRGPLEEGRPVCPLVGLPI